MRCSLALATAIVAGIGLSSCATAARWDDTSVTAIREGMTKSEVTTLIGPPDSTSVDMNGQQTWNYRRATDDKTFMDRYVQIGSLGMVDGMRSDFLTIVFNGDRVASYRFEQNAANSGGLPFSR